ncbi:MAG: hypothetical protein PVH91_14650 [Pseudomonadales bacterium]|jgi:hypothetical protein
MKKAPFQLSLILAGVLAAGGALAGPYDSWQPSVSDDDSVSIADSFNREYSSSVSSDDDSWKSVDVTRTRTSSEDNDVAVTKTHTEDNDYTSSVQEDNDWTSSVREDNDYTSIYKTSEDNDVTTTEDNDVTTTEDNDVALDFQIATPTMSSYKYQDQDAGHQADTQVYGSASGHSVGVEGGTNVISAGNDETKYYGPALVNTNTNQLPQNNLFIQGSNGAPISQSNTFAGRDMGPKGVFAPVGNTSASVGGNVGNQSGASVEQSGDAANSIADPMSSVIR